MSLVIDSMTGAIPPGIEAAAPHPVRGGERQESASVFVGEDSADISADARRLLEGHEVVSDGWKAAESGDDASRPESEDLTREERLEVDDLEKRDQEVRTHEQAHAAAGGAYVKGGPSFEFQIGPDGQRYAVNGHVSIDTSPEKDPHATIAKMRQVRRAANAPANPSGSDLRVAAKAAAEEAKARQMLMEADE